VTYGDALSHNFYLTYTALGSFWVGISVNFSDRLGEQIVNYTDDLAILLQKKRRKGYELHETFHEINRTKQKMKRKKVSTYVRRNFYFSGIEFRTLTFGD
jgi:hypothetical protein